MQKILVVSGPVIVEHNKALLDISGEDDFWKFCGGKVREDETLNEAAVRRASEELGIKVEIMSDEPFFMYKEKNTDEGKIDIILVHFVGRRKGEPKAGKEVKKWEWLDINNLPDNIGSNVIPALKHFGFI